MKYFIIPVIALGLALSLIFGVEYDCNGPEMFPTYFGSPFIFKQSSLGSSMEYYYSISGLLLNVAVWSGIITIIRFGINKLIEITLNNKFIIISYKILVGLLLLISILNFSIAYLGVGRGFENNLNYWYWNFDKEASIWGVQCKGEWKFFIK